ncbi:MAG: PilZ domain-containing protein, partial [Sphingomonas sp.]|nr:PilZ domain-containing protein [Sphingomonas sp.]
MRRTAVMIDSTGGTHEIVILDISSGGFRIEVSEAPRIGEFVTLRVEHGDEFPAQIRWALG